MAKDLTLALRVQAEFDQAQKALDGLERGIEDVGAATQSTNAKLGVNTQQVAAASQTMQRAGLSAKQYQQAMRQLPAQITDITTSLASGMPVWLVAIQQGGQIRDSFGGIGNAGRALMSTLNPLTLAIAAITGVVAAGGIAYLQGAREAFEYNKALILTGNISGTTAEELGEMAARLDDVAGTQRSAAAALAAAASTGRFTAAQIEQVGLSAELMRIATGRAVDETVEEFKKLATDPVDAIAKLNDQYHFLTASVYEQIKALQDQGDEAGAAKLAVDTYAEAMNSRAAEIKGNLGLIERGWNAVKSGAAEAWDAMLGIGRDETLDERLQAAREQLEALQASDRNYDFYGNKKSDQVAVAQRAVELLEAEKRARDEAAEREAAEQRRHDAAITAQREIDKLREETLSRVEKKEKAIAEYRANVEKARAGGIDVSDSQIEKDLAAIEKKFAEPARKTPKGPTDSTFESLNRQITERVAALEAATQAETKLTDAQRFAAQVQASLADGTTKLTDEQREQIAVRLQALAVADRAAQASQDTKALADVQTQYLRAIGDNQAVAQAEIERRYGELLKRLEARGDQAGIDLVKKLINVEQAKSQIGELQREIDAILGNQSRGEQSVQTQLQAGLLTEIDARERIVDLSRQSAEKLAEIRPQLMELSKMPGDVGAAASTALAALDQQVQQLNATTSLLGETLRVSFQEGLAGALSALATGATDLRGALQGLLDSVINSLAQLSAQALSQKLVTSIAGLFGGGQQTDMTAGAAAVAASAGALSAAGGTLLTGAAAIQAAAASLAAANATAGIGSVAAATGGHITGPGTGTSDSIRAWLSNNEFVTRAAVVTQPGALPFLHDFNRHGMAALDRWNAAVHHATGGLAGVPAPEMPEPGLSRGRMEDPARQMATTVENGINLYLLDDPQRIADVAFGSRAGQESFYLMLSRDPAKVRSLLNL